MTDHSSFYIGKTSLTAEKVGIMKTSKTTKKINQSLILSRGKTGILTFSLPEEREDFELACKAVSLQVALDEISNYMRTVTKYGLNEKMKQAILMNKGKESAITAILWVIREDLAEIINERTNT